MTKKVYLVRHGETLDLVQKLHQKNDVSLSDRGNRQAQDVARRFGHISVDVIFSSPYRRTLETAKHIGSITGAPIEEQDLLRERCHPKEIIGKGRDDAEVIRIKSLANDNRNDAKWHYSDEENFFDFRERVVRAQKLVEQDKRENIVLVTHAVFIKIFTLHAVFGDLLTPDLFNSYYHHVRTSQTGITMFEYKEGSWKMLTWNDYAHLGEDLVGTEYR